MKNLILKQKLIKTHKTWIKMFLFAALLCKFKHQPFILLFFVLRMDLKIKAQPKTN